MKKTLLLLSFIVLSASLIAQNSNRKSALIPLNDFRGIQSVGPTPTDLRLSLYELYTLDKQRVREYTDGKLPNSDKVLAASWHINRLMASGRILYGDPITRMVERIADTLLKDYPGLRKELRFYTIKSPEVNAFATGQGMIFFCTGLIAQVEDEAQLAFVVSHEIVHYLRKHSLEEITRRKKDSDDIDAETQEMRDFIKYHNRSREMESEADSLGITMFYLQSPYDKNVTDGFFDVLQYGYLPFDELPFNENFFNTPYYRMPSEYFLEELAPITARDDYNDSLSTHPNILKRRMSTSRILASGKGGVNHLMFSPEEFENIRTLARFECVRQDLIHAEYARAFYDCYLLLKQYPDNVFVNRALCQSLYGMSKHKTYSNSSIVVGDYKDYEGEVQQSYYFFRKIQKEDLALITARQLWKTMLQFPEDKKIADMADDIFADLYETFGYKVDFFSATYDTSMVSDSIGAGNTTKYQRIKQKKNKQRINSSRSFAFTDFLQQDARFSDYLASHLTNHEAQTSSNTATDRQLVYRPGYFVANYNSGKIKYKKSKNNEQALRLHLAKTAQSNGIATVDFSDQSLHETETDQRYNEFVAINEWVQEYWTTKGKFHIINTMQDEMNVIRKKYNINTINMTTILNMEGRGNEDFTIFSLIPPFTPIGIESALSNREVTAIHSVQIDASNGSTLRDTRATQTSRDGGALILSTLYDHYRLLQDTNNKVPGYLGSRFIVTLTPSVGLGAIKSRRNSRSAAPGASLLSYGAYIDAHYIIKRNSSLGLSFGYIPAYFDNGSITAETNIMNFYLKYNYYYKHDLAPLGRYLTMGMGITDYRFPILMAGHLKDNMFFGLQFGFGRNYIVGRHLSLGYNVQYSFVASGWMKRFYSLDLDYSSDPLASDAQVINLFRVGMTFSIIP